MKTHNCQQETKQFLTLFKECNKYKMRAQYTNSKSSLPQKSYETPTKKSKALQEPTPLTLQKTPSKQVTPTFFSSSHPIVEYPIGYQYNKIAYRDGLYYGKIIYTCQKESQDRFQGQQQKQKIKNLPHILNIQEQQEGVRKQYKHGGGVLILDCGIWIIGVWQYDQLVSNSYFIISGELGVIQIDQQKEEQRKNYLIRGIKYYRSHLEGDESAKRQTIVGQLDQVNQNSTWTWRVNIQDIKSMKNREKKNRIELVTEKNMNLKPQDNEKQRNLIINLKQVIDNVDNVEEKQNQQSYDSFIRKIGQILNKDSENEKKYFEIKEIKQTIKVGCTNFKPSWQKKSIQASIASCFDNSDNIYIDLAVQQFLDSKNKGDALFFIKGLHIVQNLKLKNLRPMQSFVYKYSYQIRNSWEREIKSHKQESWIKTKIPIFEAAQIVSQLEQPRFQYSLLYNIFCKEKMRPISLLPSIYYSEEGQYMKSTQKKSRLHLSDSKYNNKSHSQLTKHIVYTLLSIYSVDYYARHIRSEKASELQRSQKEVEKKGKVNVPRESTIEDIKKQILKVKGERNDKKDDYNPYLNRLKLKVKKNQLQKTRNSPVKQDKNKVNQIWASTQKQQMKGDQLLKNLASQYNEVHKLLRGYRKVRPEQEIETIQQAKGNKEGEWYHKLSGKIEQKKKI